MPAMGGASWVSYIVKVRSREQWETDVHKSTGKHKRRVTRWGKWKSVRWRDDARGALEDLDVVRKSNPLIDVAVFYGSKRLTIEQLHARAASEAKR